MIDYLPVFVGNILVSPIALGPIDENKPNLCLLISKLMI
jgi:hypothetical protein